MLCHPVFLDVAAMLIEDFIPTASYSATLTQKEKTNVLLWNLTNSSLYQLVAEH